MTFIIIFIALIIERFFHWGHLRHWRWFGDYESWLSARIGSWSSYFMFVICLLPVLVLIGGIDLILSDWWYGIFKLIFGAIILLYCLGADNLWVQVYDCLSALHKEDPSAAFEKTKIAFGMVIPQQDQDIHSQAFHHAFLRAIFIAANERIFAVICWFAIFGPLGAVLYRLIEVFGKQSALGLAPAAVKIQQGLDWMPIRLFTFLFALAGNFMEVFAQWKHYMVQGVNTNDILLTGCGMAAINVLEDQPIPVEGTAEKEALALLDRVLIIGLVILATIVLLT